MYDSLDTMLLMGLHEEFNAAMLVVQAGSFGKVCVTHLDRLQPRCSPSHRSAQLRMTGWYRYTGTFHTHTWRSNHSCPS